jgi:hypothetical protein
MIRCAGEGTDVYGDYDNDYDNDNDNEEDRESQPMVAG